MSTICIYTKTKPNKNNSDIFAIQCKDENRWYAFSKDHAPIYTIAEDIEAIASLREKEETLKHCKQNNFNYVVKTKCFSYGKTRVEAINQEIVSDYNV